MKETGMIFSGDHPKLILDGIKTMTRRVLKPQPIDVLPMPNPTDGWVALTETNPNHGKVIKCRFGQVGDRLWVRETWRKNARGGISFKADEGSNWIGKWTPSIFMPRWASRITLEIIEVRVERLQEMPATDALKEGIKLKKPYIHADLKVLADFKDLWDSLNAKRGYGWDTNPFVCCISFKEANDGK